ncbi:MAG: hypothetical protein VKP62_01245 [Candidatus Sericytochromatia bacterium]|nr:hypothetical protein [Candidatus Sericytochromatia bacterium]
MKNPAYPLGLVLSAAVLLSGCAKELVGQPPIKMVQASASLKRTTVAPNSGSVRVSFAGLSPRARTYRTLATRTDIESVYIYLSDSRNGQSRELDRKELERPRVDLAFKSVATGPITMRVEARDQEGLVIGEAQQQAQLRSGENLLMNLNVALIETGNVGAVIQFVDPVVPTPPCTLEAAFKQADKDGDKFLQGEEYASAWPFQLVPCDFRGTLPPRVVRPLDPTHPGLTEMLRKDRNRDGKISFEEFTAAATPVVPPQPSHPCLGMFQQGDTNKDGKVSLAEWMAAKMAPPVPNLSEIFKAQDKDKDGFLSPRESCGAVAETSVPAPGPVVPQPVPSVPPRR